MKNDRFRNAALPIILFLFLWGCSSHPKPVETIKEPPPPPEKEIAQEPVTEEEAPVPLENVEPEVQANVQEKPAELPEENPADVLEEALDAYQDALLSWERGDFETALAALDEAYSLILKLDLPQDSPLIQEKNDLRLLIAQRIQEIYASRLIVIGDNNQTIPLEENNEVKAEIRNFQTKERKFFEDGYKRSGLYREMILKELRDAGVPEQLSWLPLIESWFKARAFSRARALGLWQFIASTGYRYGLKRDRWVDERMDPVKSTRAAISYLKELHALFGDWLTAIASYNCGEYKVQRAIRNQRVKYLDNFWDLYRMLPRETARFVPRFIAALLIINDPEKYGLNLPTPYPPQRYEAVSISRPIKLSALSKALGLAGGDLAALNPELRHQSTPDRSYFLKVPEGYDERTISALDSLPRYIPPEATYFFHYVRRGETLSRIAKRYRTSISSIARLNNLRRVNLIRPGQRLKIPGRGSSFASRPSLKLTVEGENLVYVVRRGDNLYRIANAFNTTVQQIKKKNNLKSNVLRVGQKLVISSGRPQGAIIYTVKRGDSPFEIAKKYGMNLNYLLTLNGLTIRSKIYPGQELWVIPKNQ